MNARDIIRAELASLDFRTVAAFAFDGTSESMNTIADAVVRRLTEEGHLPAEDWRADAERLAAELRSWHYGDCAVSDDPEATCICADPEGAVALHDALIAVEMERT